MTIAHFNAMNPERAAATVSRCANIPRWVNAIVARRPFPTVDRLLEFAERASMCWTQEEINLALARHPNITEHAVTLTGRMEPPGGDLQQSVAAQSHELRILALHRLEWLLGD